MLSAQDIISAVQQSCTGLGKVGGMGDYAAVADQLRVTRSVYVMPPVETAERSSSGTEVVRQRSHVEVTLMCGFIVRNANAIVQTGDVDTVRETLKSFFIGWTPDNSVYLPFQFVSFQPSHVSKDGFSVWYALKFTTDYQLFAAGP